MRALVSVDEGAFLDDALRVARLSERDRALAWFVANGALRHRASVDAALRGFLRQPISALEPAVRAVLRAGTFERLYGRAAPHAVVHEAVEVTSRVGAGRASGLVNAVLRRVRRVDDLTRWESLEHPEWLVERWTARYGAAATDAWCAANNEPPPLTLAGPALSAWRDRIAEVVEQVTPARAGGEPVPDALTVHGARGAVDALPGFAEGAFWVQDAAAIAVADRVPVIEGGRVLDACAAPGGKAFRMASRGAHVTATDREPARLERVGESASRLGLTIDCRQHDWRDGRLADETFDAVLVDAPCSALGTVRRHPEVRWRRHPLDLERTATTQRAILDAVIPHVRPGGALVYAVCSAEPEEGEAHVQPLGAAHPDLALVDRWASAPPTDGEDAHQVWVWRRAT